MQSKWTRREFMQRLGVGAAGLALAACQPAVPPAAPAAAPAAAEEKKEEAPAAAKCEVTQIRVSHSWPAEEWPRQVEFDNVFNGENECVKVTGENIVWGDYVPKLTAMAAAGTLPDVVYCQFAWAQQFIMDGMVINLQPFLEKDTEFWGKDDFVPQALVTYQWQNDQYLIPYNEGPTNLIYYNVRIFDEAKIPYPHSDKDWTLDDMLQAAKELTKGEGADKVWGYDGLPGMWGALNADWLYPWDAKWWNEPCETESFIHEEAAIQCLQWWVDVRLKHKVAPTPADVQTMPGNPFATGHVAMIKGASWDNRWIKPNLKDPYDVAHAPVGPKGKRSSSTMGSAYGITKDAKNKDAAWQYLRSYTSTEGQIFNWSSIGIDPARWSAWPAYFESDAVPPHAKVVMEVMKTYGVHEVLDSPNGREISLVAQPIWDRAMLGELPVADACKQITEACSPIMAKNADWCAKSGLVK